MKLLGYGFAEAMHTKCRKSEVPYHHNKFKGSALSLKWKYKGKYMYVIGWFTLKLC